MKSKRVDWNQVHAELAAEYGVDIEVVRQLDFYAERIAAALPPPSPRQRARLAELFARHLPADDSPGLTA